MRSRSIPSALAVLTIGLVYRVTPQEPSQLYRSNGMGSVSQVPVWFDRKFDFSFPVEMHPNLCARLRGTPARLEDALRGRANEVLTHKPRQKWSAQEHAGHLLDLEPLWLARVEDYVKGSEQLAITDLQNRKTDDANYNSQPLEQILAKFRAARKTLLKRVEGLDVGLFSRPIPHPRLKVPMRLVDHLFFVAEHDDHHLAKIWELVNRE
ncbi:MAG: DinB family protein [Candidatus Sulfotelmatobacter sp.]